MSLKDWTDKARSRFLVLFIALSVVGIAIVALQAVRAAQSSEDTKRNLLGDPEHPPFVAVISLPGFTRFVVTNPSGYPAYGVKVQLYDEACGNQKPIRSYEYNDMASHAAVIDDQPWTPTNSAPQQRFTASISTRAGLVRQEMILRRSGNNQWMRASRTRNGMQILGQDVDSSWPRNSKGEIDFQW
ncbi:MAG: hypothetical protein LLG20_18825 [Acidobacteriales bacterium]|nr:hypothetical protein [Terriglobales bacterium]